MAIQEKQLSFPTPSDKLVFSKGAIAFAKAAVQPLLVPILVLLVWQRMALSINNPLILPELKSVLSILVHPTADLLRLGSLIHNISVSLLRIALGYTLAAVVAIPLGILMGYSSNVRGLFQGLLAMIRPIPPLAWVPLILAWMGTTSMASVLNLNEGLGYVWLSNIRLSMVFIIFIGSFFPMFLSTMFGIRNVRRTLIDCALTLGASERDLISKVLLQAAMPNIFSGLRNGMGVAWSSLVAAEMLPGSIAGLGYLITHAQSFSRIDVVMAGMVTISAVGSLLDLIFRIIDEKKFRWVRLGG
ncbi:MAG: ABC transporter permease [bacterium]